MCECPNVKPDPAGFTEMLYERVTGKRPAWQRETVHEAVERYKP